VIDGTRTRDNRNHNPGLYQLSYDHRYRRATRLAQPSWLAKRKISRFVKLAYVRVMRSLGKHREKQPVELITLHSKIKPQQSSIVIQTEYETAPHYELINDY
jgi:hypothetical protein